MVAGNLVIETKLHDRTEDRSDDQRQSCSVGPDDGYISQDQKPSAQKTVVIAKAVFRI